MTTLNNRVLNKLRSRQDPITSSKPGKLMRFDLVKEKEDWDCTYTWDSYQPML